MESTCSAERAIVDGNLTPQSTGHLLGHPIGNIEAYIRTVLAIPVLTAEEERALAVRLQKFNDLDAARQLVLSQLRFVVHVARGYSGYGLQQADLIQEGNIGLMKAVKRFDPSLNVRLVSFAVYWIRAEMHEFILRNWRIVKVATTKAQRKLFFNLRSSKKALGWFSHAEVEAVAKDLGVSPHVVREMEARMSGHDASFDLHMEDDDGEIPYAPAAYLTDSRLDPAQLMEEGQTEARDSEQLVHALASLDERSRDIVKRRWLGNTKATLQELADEYQLSAERIRQIESGAFKKLKAVMAA